MTCIVCRQSKKGVLGTLKIQPFVRFEFCALGDVDWYPTHLQPRRIVQKPSTCTCRVVATTWTWVIAMTRYACQWGWTDAAADNCRKEQRRLLIRRVSERRLVHTNLCRALSHHARSHAGMHVRAITIRRRLWQRGDLLWTWRETLA